MRRGWWLGAACGAGLVSLVSAAEVEPVLRAQEAAQAQAAQSQQRVDALDDESRRLLEEYRHLLAERERLARYNDQVARLVRNQERERLSLEGQLEELAVTRREILPLMEEMAETLAEVVEADLPFLPLERRARVTAVRALLDDPEASLADRYRRLLEAYLVEAGYGRTLEVRERTIELDGAARTVEVLRVGRLALFYRSLDGREVGRWDASARRWVRLPEELREGLDQAFAVARKQAAPELLLLPLPAPGVAP